MNFKDYIFLEDSYMDKGGLGIYYTYKGEERTILANPAEEAAKLLLKNDLIESYSGTGNDIEVTWLHSFSRVDFNNELIEEEMKVEASWETFVREVGLSAEDAVTIAAMEECEREANEVASVFDKIRDGITKFVSSVFL